jgi:beta-lactamase regulating signal transducer with metallopeptidase domain
MDSVLNWLWQGGIVALASFANQRMLERARANVRYGVCWAAILLILALPAVSWLQSIAPRPDAFVPLSGDAVVSLPDTWWTSILVIGLAWIVWAGICLVRFVFAMVAIGRARHRSRLFPEHLQSALPHWNRARLDGRRATLVVSDSVTTAAVLGCGTPMIAVAPSLISTLDADELDRVVIHEWAHVQRRDDLVNILQIAIWLVAGWHPAIWWLDHRVRIEREMACDETTVAITGSPKSYAHCLLKLASLRGPARAMQAAPAIFMVTGLRARITKIITPRRSIAPVWSRSIAVAAVSGLCVMSVGVGGLQLVEAAAFALPFAPSRAIGPTLERLAPVAAPAIAPHADVQPAPRRIAVPAASAPRSTSAAVADRVQERSPAPSPEPAPAPPVAVGQPAVEPRHPDAADTAADRPVVPGTETVLPVTPSAVSFAAAAAPRSPWAVAADSGTAVGRKSRDAGVATAGFFSRVARRVAGSF